MKNKKLNYLLLSLLSAVLGFICGFIVWSILKVINVLTELIWEIIPECIGIHTLVYNLIICIIGAIVIILLTKKFGELPHLTEEVFTIIKKDGSYPYNNLPICIIAAIIPLIFGGTLGPEAGLVGVIAGLCCWVGDNLKYRGEKLQTLAETGFSIALSIVFFTPLPGIIANLEPDNKKEKYSQKFKNKANRIVIYCLGVAGGFLAMYIFGQLWNIILPGSSEGGLPHFVKDFWFDPMLLLWAIPLIPAGIIIGGLYSGLDIGLQKIRKLFKNSKLIPALLAAIALAICGYFFPDSMFSGEHQLQPIANNFESYDASYLFIIAALKIILVCVCLNFGWRGGSIFPIISGLAFVALGIALLAGINGNFAMAVCISAGYAFICRKPIMAAALLLLCFPPSYLPIVIISAFIASKVPNPFITKVKDK